MPTTRDSSKFLSDFVSTSSDELVDLPMPSDWQTFALGISFLTVHIVSVGVVSVRRDRTFAMD